MVISQFYESVPSAKKRVRETENGGEPKSSTSNSSSPLLREVSIDQPPPQPQRPQEEEEEPIRLSSSLSSSSLSPSQSTQEQENTDDVIGLDVELTTEEIQELSQQWNPFEHDDDGDDNDDSSEVDEDAPERIDFSQVMIQPQQSIESDDEEEEEQEAAPPSPKRSRHHEDRRAFRMVDSDDKWFLDDGREWKVFKKGERFSTNMGTLGLPEKVYTIIRFFRDRHKGKMAMCHVSILAEKTFLGQGYDRFDRKEFENTFHSPYVGCRYSQNKPLSKLKYRVQQQQAWNEPMLHFDPPVRDTKGPGWTLAYSLDKSFANEESCIVEQAPAAIDMFAGAGGMGIGLENAGFRVTHAVEKDPVAAATLNLNHRNHTTVFPQCVETFFEEAKKAEENTLYHCGGISHAHGSSPCQGFSLMNTTGSEASKEKNNKLSLIWAEFVISQKMITGSFENVTGMLSPKRVCYIQEMVNMFVMNDYGVRVGVLDSSQFGDPQARKRVIILVSKAPYSLPEMPKPTHGANLFGDSELLPIRSPKDAIGDLEDIEPRPGPGILVLPPPSSVAVTHHVTSDQLYDLHTETLEADKPARTILCGHAIGHYNLPRACTNLEGARLQSFPDTWKFAGSHREIQKQIGNAVPIQLATAVAKAVFDVYIVDPNIFSPPDIPYDEQF